MSNSRKVSISGRPDDGDLYLELTEGNLRVEQLYLPHAYTIYEAVLHGAQTTSTAGQWEVAFQPTGTSHAMFDIVPGRIYKWDGGRLQALNNQEVRRHRIIRCLAPFGIGQLHWKHPRFDYDIQQRGVRRLFCSDGEESRMHEGVAKVRGANFLIIQPFVEDPKSIALVSDSVDLSGMVHRIYTGHKPPHLHWHDC